MVYRLAAEKDIDGIVSIYDHIHTTEEAGITTVGWIRGIYPTRATALAALERGDLYVCALSDAESAKLAEEIKACKIKDNIIATAVINQIQVDVYADVEWECSADDEHVLVLHTLAVEPGLRFNGLGRGFVQYYEQMARERGCTDLRMDTNSRNKAAREFYAGLGYREVGVIPTVFNGIPGVDLIMLEKPLDRAGSI